MLTSESKLGIFVSKYFLRCHHKGLKSLSNSKLHSVTYIVNPILSILLLQVLNGKLSFC